jgi:hypothetical protein
VGAVPNRPFYGDNLAAPLLPIDAMNPIELAAKWRHFVTSPTGCMTRVESSGETLDVRDMKDGCAN